MFVYSGPNKICECGIETDIEDTVGVRLKTGDIVVCYIKDKPPSRAGLTVIATNQYDDEPEEFFPVGLRGAARSGDGWKVRRVKRHSDVVAGEHWQDFGFHYEEV